MAGRQWTMNCVITGAAVLRLVMDKKLVAAGRKLEELTSELTKEDIDYLLLRIIKGN